MPTTIDMSLGNLLVEHRLATSEQIKECLAIQTRLPQPANLGEILVRKGYLSEQHARQALAAISKNRSTNASNMHNSNYGNQEPQRGGPSQSNSNSGPSASHYGNPSRADADIQLGQTLMTQNMVTFEQVQAAVALRDRYHQSGHTNITLGQILVQQKLVSEGIVRSLLNSIAARSASSQEVQSSGPHTAPGYGAANSPSGPYPAAPSPSGPYPAAPSAQGSGPMAAPGHMGSGPMAAPGTHYGSAHNSPVPILGVESQSMDRSASANLVTPGFLGADQGEAPLETCISSEDPIARRMKTVKKPDGTFEIEFGPYDILGEIARGGMGIVYRARQRDLKRIVALKVMKDGENASEKQIRRFRRETEAAAKLQHPNIVAVHEVGCIQDFHFFTMDIIEGDPLDVRIKKGQLPAQDESVKAVMEVSKAIHYAHSKKIVHRDLKPANILMDLDGHPKVTDFGLAKNIDHKSMLTRTGAVVGTPYYMPPEQIRGDTDIDARCDVYALGVILYELLTGKLPFKGETTMEVYHKILEEEPKTPRDHNSKIPKDLDVIAMKAMDKERGRRYQTAADLADDLQRYLDGEPIKARPIGFIGKALRKASKHRAAVTICSLGLTIMLAVLGTTIVNIRDSQWREALNHARTEWDNYTLGLETNLLRVDTCIKAAQRKNKDNKGQRALQDLEQARNALAELPKDINQHCSANSRERVSMYYLCMDGKFRDQLYLDGKPRNDIDYAKFVETTNAWIEEQEFLTTEKPIEDDLLGGMDDSVYIPVSVEGVRDYIEFVRTGATDLGETGDDSINFKVESPISTRNLSYSYRDIYTERGHAYVLRGDAVGFKKALAQYQKALEFDSQTDAAKQIRLEIGKVLALAGDPKKALTHFNKIVEQYPSFLPAYLERGLIYMTLRQYEEGIADYTHVIEKDDDAAFDAYLARGRAFMKIGQFSRAEKDFEEAIDAQTDNFAGFLARGHAYIALGSIDEAEPDLTQAVTLNSSIPDCYSSRADLCVAQGKFDDAIKEYEVALVRGSRYYPAFLGMARTYELQLNYEEAEKRYKDVIDSVERGIEKYKAKAHKSLARLAALKADIRVVEDRVIEKNVRNAGAEQDELYESALKHLEKAKALDGFDNEVHWLEGLVLLASGRKEEAVKCLQIAASGEKQWNSLVSKFEDPNGGFDSSFGSQFIGEAGRRKGRQALMFGVLGILQMELGQKEDGRANCRKAIEFDDESSIAAICKAFTSNLQGEDRRKLYDNASKAMLNEFENKTREKSGIIGHYFSEAMKKQDLAADSRKPEQFRQARRSYARVLFFNPWHFMARFNRARLEQDWDERNCQKNLDGAVKDVSLAIVHNPFLQTGYSFRGFLFSEYLPKQKNKNPGTSEFEYSSEKAQSDFTKAIELSQDKADKAHAYFGRAAAIFGILPDGDAESPANPGENADADKPGDSDAKETEGDETTSGEGEAEIKPKLASNKPQVDPVDQATLDKSLKDLDQAITVAPKDAKTATILRNKISYHKLRAKILALLGQAEEAAADLNAIKILDEQARTNAKAYLVAGRHKQDGRLYEEAITEFTRAIEFNPKMDDAFYNRGLCLLKVGNFIPGIIDFSRALELNPRYADQFYNKVYQVNYVVDLKRVMEELNKIVEERPNVSYVVFLRGFFYVAKSEFKDFEPSDLDRGVADFNRCLEINPGHVTAKTYRGLLFLKKRLFDKALKDFHDAISADPKSGITQYLKALAFATMAGDVKGKERTDLEDKAIKCLNRAFKNNFRGFERIKKDKGFSNLDDRAEYKDLLDRFRP